MSETVVRLKETSGDSEVCCAGRVLDILRKISSGEISSTDEISRIYGDVDSLIERVEKLRSRFSGLSLGASPYLEHLKRMAELESDLKTV